jgi:short-subunit dehydrogenase
MYLELKMQDAPVSVSFLAPSGVRTAIFDTPSHAPGGELQDMLRGAIEAMGMPPEELAEITFAALKERKFWILPHPDFKEGLQRRIERIAAEQPPEFG